VDQLAKSTLVGAGGIGFVEPVEPEPAQRALACFIKRMAIQKWRLASAAIEVRGKRLRGPKATAAYRDS
jgi:hypothetical protein